MPFAFFDHTGDIGVRLSGRTLDDLFGAAADAFTVSITDPQRVEPRQTVHFSLESAALDLLLVDFLNELLYRFETDQFLVATVDLHLDRGAPATSLHATVHGEVFDARRHAIKVLIKAVTYHALEVREAPDGWQATVIFDI